MKEGLRPIRWACTIVGAVVLALTCLASAGVGEFRMCYGKTGKCRLANESVTQGEKP